MTSVVRFLAESNLTRQNNQNNNDARVRSSAVQLMNEVYGEQFIETLYTVMCFSFFISTVSGALAFLQVMKALGTGFKCDVPLDIYLFIELGLLLLSLLFALFFRFVSVGNRLSAKNKRRFETSLLVFTILFELCKFGVHIFGIYLLGISKTCAKEENPIFLNIAACASALILAQITYVTQFVLFEIILYRLRKGSLTTPATEAISKVKKFELVNTSEEVCSICLNEMNEPHRKTSCQHEFHENCLISWLSASAKSCPICRTNVFSEIPHTSVIVSVENAQIPAQPSPPPQNEVLTVQNRRSTEDPRVEMV